MISESASARRVNGGGSLLMRHTPPPPPDLAKIREGSFDPPDPSSVAALANVPS